MRWKVCDKERGEGEESKGRKGNRERIGGDRKEREKERKREGEKEVE